MKLLSTFILLFALWSKKIFSFDIFVVEIAVFASLLSYLEMHFHVYNYKVDIRTQVSSIIFVAYYHNIMYLYINQYFFMLWETYWPSYLFTHEQIVFHGQQLCSMDEVLYNFHVSLYFPQFTCKFALNSLKEGA